MHLIFEYCYVSCGYTDKYADNFSLYILILDGDTRQDKQNVCLLVSSKETMLGKEDEQEGVTTVAVVARKELP